VIRAKKRNKQKLQQNRPTELAAVAAVLLEARTGGLTLRQLIQFYRQQPVRDSRPPPNARRIAVWLAKQPYVRPVPANLALFAVSFGRLGSEDVPID